MQAIAPRRLSPADAAAILAYVATGGTVARYATGARALPPTYSDKQPRRPRFYCLHQPYARVSLDSPR